MGDLKQKPLQEIWNDARLVDLRAKMARGTFRRSCPARRATASGAIRS